jgi:hypothetical protein
MKKMTFFSAEKTEVVKAMRTRQGMMRVRVIMPSRLPNETPTVKGLDGRAGGFAFGWNAFFRLDLNGFSSHFMYA